jgi:hypothetical protein
MLRTHRNLKAYWQPCEEDDQSFSLFRVKRSIRAKTCRSATLSATNPTRTDPESNPGLRDERPATNRLSHGTALVPSLLSMAFTV